MKYIKYLFAILFITQTVCLFSQDDDDLLSMLDDVVEDEALEVVATFKSTRIINSHTIERMKKQQLDFRVNHRFGMINSGYENFWGLDEAYISLDFGYGINDWLMVGLRRSTFNKTIDGSLKFSILRQKESGLPISVSYYTNMAANGEVTPKWDTVKFTNRLAFTHQVLVASKINDAISLQLMPTYVHRNLVEFDEENDIISVGIGGRVKVTRRLSITGEYFWASHTSSNDKYYNPLSLGFDLETGGHVFQFFLTNTQMMEESSFISQTTSSWLDGGLYFGFNISRVFAIGKVH